MEQLKEWVAHNMVQASWGNYEGINDLTIDQLKELKKLVKGALIHAKLKHSEDSLFTILVHQMNTIASNETLDWDAKFDLIFCKEISQRIHSLVRLDYHDPDTSYEEDVMAFVNSVNDYVENDNV